MQSWTIGNAVLFVQQGDLTAIDIDGVVNAANSRLAGGGGVDGAIHRAAGEKDLQTACRDIISRIGSLPPGQAVITPGFALPARWIIHTVGPVWRGGTRGEAATLHSAYHNSLRLAREHGLEGLAFPAISCGVYGYPVADAARVAVKALAEGLRAGLVRRAGMVLHSADAHETWAGIATELLGAPASS